MAISIVSHVATWNVHPTPSSYYGHPFLTIMPSLPLVLAPERLIHSMEQLDSWIAGSEIYLTRHTSFQAAEQDYHRHIFHRPCRYGFTNIINFRYRHQLGTFDSRLRDGLLYFSIPFQGGMLLVFYHEISRKLPTRQFLSGLYSEAVTNLSETSFQEYLPFLREWLYLLRISCLQLMLASNQEWQESLSSEPALIPAMSENLLEDRQWESEYGWTRTRD